MEEDIQRERRFKQSIKWGVITAAVLYFASTSVAPTIQPTIQPGFPRPADWEYQKNKRERNFDEALQAETLVDPLYIAPDTIVYRDFSTDQQVYVVRPQADDVPVQDGIAAVFELCEPDEITYYPLDEEVNIATDRTPLRFEERNVYEYGNDAVVIVCESPDQVKE